MRFSKFTINIACLYNACQTTYIGIILYRCTNDARYHNPEALSLNDPDEICPYNAPCINFGIICLLLYYFCIVIFAEALVLSSKANGSALPLPSPKTAY